MSAHTPGPWRLSLFGRPSVAFGDTGIVIYDDPPDVATANARLIAAAPDLLEALKAFNLAEEQIVAGQADHLVVRLPLDVIAKAAAAVAKAEGTS